jgi:hypothetical protein
VGEEAQCANTEHAVNDAQKKDAEMEEVFVLHAASRQNNLVNIV